MKTAYKASGVAVRDARATHAGPDVAKPKAAKKDTKRWCGGHVGREHTLECQPYPGSSRFTGVTSLSKRWRELVCTVCGKRVAHWYPCRNETDAPEWVTKEAR